MSASYGRNFFYQQGPSEESHEERVSLPVYVYFSSYEREGGRQISFLYKIQLRFDYENFRLQKLDVRL